MLDCFLIQTRISVPLYFFITSWLVSCLVYPASKSSMATRDWFYHADLVSYPPFFYFLKHLHFLKKLFLGSVLMSLGYCIYFCCPSIGASLVGNVLLLLSGFPCCICACWLLFIFWHGMSVGQSSVSNSYPAQFDLVLPRAVVWTFPFFDAWFNIV